jgi:uncharacterized membrane protein
MSQMKKQLEALQTQAQKLETETRQTVTNQLENLTRELGKNHEETPDLRKTLGEEAALLKKTGEVCQKIHRSFSELTDQIDTQLRESQHQEKRLKRKFHLLNPAPTNAQIDLQEKTSRHFAQGITFYKLFWVFFIGCFLGVVVEVLWCIITRGHYESRVGLIYGPFNLVYGFGAWGLSACLYRYRNRNPIFSFLGGFLVGSVIEYLCSWFQEMVFGSTSWDYSHMPFNINGRICLVYSLFWGILGVLWIKEIYPRMAKWILRIPNRVGKPLTWILLVFMIFNSVMTAATVLRWMDRRAGEKPDTAFAEWIDRHYPDERMQKIFANMEFVE